MSSLLLLIFLSWWIGEPAHSLQNKSPAPPVETQEVEVPIIAETSSRQCARRFDDPVGPVIDEAAFRKLTTPDAGSKTRASDDRCAFLNELKVDFSKHSLLTYRVRGDCFIHANAIITRNDTLKKYTLHISRIYGGCRAAGSVESWLVVEKLRPEYQVESVILDVKEWSGRRP